MYPYTIRKNDKLFIGNLVVRHEHYDHRDQEIMLIVYDPALAHGRRSRPFFVRVHHPLRLNNGAFVVVQSATDKKNGPTVGGCRVAVINPDALPIRLEKSKVRLEKNERRKTKASVIRAG